MGKVKKDPPRHADPLRRPNDEERVFSVLHQCLKAASWPKDEVDADQQQDKTRVARLARKTAAKERRAGREENRTRKALTLGARSTLRAFSRDPTSLAAVLIDADAALEPVRMALSAVQAPFALALPGLREKSVKTVGFAVTVMGVKRDQEVESVKSLSDVLASMAGGEPALASDAKGTQ